MEVTGKPKWCVCVYGDWSTIVSVRDYVDAIIGQKPDNREDAEFMEVRVECQTAKELVDAYTAFSAKQLHCEIAARHNPSDKYESCFVATGNGWGSKPEPFCQFRISDPTSRQSVAIKEAIAILQEVAP